MNHTEIENHGTHETVYAHGATATRLRPFLDPRVPWVWILGHCPDQTVRWWNATVPLNPQGQTFAGQVRELAFDLQLPTAEFLSLAGEFDDHGLVLIQSHFPMPDTLCLERVPEARQLQVLVQNGATLRLWLSHAVETAQVQSYVPGWLWLVLCDQDNGDGHENDC